jgi:RNA polymerase sigma-70 factor (ECF subfamily)
MHRARGTFLKGGAVLPWAFAIARRLVLDQVRSDDRTLRVLRCDDGSASALAVSPVDRPEQVAEARQLAASLAATLARLPGSQRTAFELLKRDGLTLAEAAASLGVTVTAVKLRAHRAYVSLRGTLGEHLGGLQKTVRP